MPLRFSRHWSIRSVLLTAFCLLILLPYLITGVYYTASMLDQMRSDKNHQLRSDSEQILQDLTSMMEETQRISYLPIVDSDISRILRTQHTTYDTAYYADEVRMEQAIKDATSINPSIFSVVFYTASGDIFQVNHLSSSPLQEDPAWQELARRSNDGCYTAPVQRNPVDIRVLPVIYTLYDSLDDQCIGYARIDYNLDVLLSTCLSRLSSGSCLAVSQDGVMLLDSGNRISSLETAPFDSGHMSFSRLKLDGRTLAGQLAGDEKTRIRFLVYQNADLLGEPAIRRLFLYLFFLGSALVLVLALSYFFIGRIGGSIRDLSLAMDSAQHGETHPLQVQDHALIHTELEGLRESYNAMIHRLNESAQREAAAKLEQKNAAIRVLESQINPHFLYNTLNLIASLAELEHVSTVQTVAVDLASVFRYAIKGDSMVHVEEELKETEAYVEILRMRFPERLSISWDIDPDTLRCMVPKLLLQPLLENSVKYGTEASGGVLTVHVSIRRQDRDLCLTVRDNGPGIRPDRLAALRQQLIDYVPGMSMGDGTSIGLLNVHARTRARFGKPYGVTIGDTQTGCLISILVPWITGDA